MLLWVNLTVFSFAFYAVKKTQIPPAFANDTCYIRRYFFSFHSIRSLLELAKTAPETVRPVIENDMYVDDLLTGCSKLEEAKYLQNKLIERLQVGGFPLQKW